MSLSPSNLVRNLKFPLFGIGMVSFLLNCSVDEKRGNQNSLKSSSSTKTDLKETSSKSPAAANEGVAAERNSSGDDHAVQKANSSSVKVAANGASKSSSGSGAGPPSELGLASQEHDCSNPYSLDNETYEKFCMSKAESIP